MNKQSVAPGMQSCSSRKCPKDKLPDNLPGKLSDKLAVKLSVKPGGEKREALTSRELECLKWAAAGKTSHDIAELLCLSESTVNFHFKNGMCKLDARNRAHAVAKAISSSLIASNW